MPSPLPPPLLPPPLLPPPLASSLPILPPEDAAYAYAYEIARRTSLEEDWSRCTAEICRLEEQVNDVWEVKDLAVLETACDELSAYITQLLELMDTLNGLGDVDEQDSARRFERCAGSSASETSAADEDVDEWTRICYAIIAAEDAVREDWMNDINRLAERCYELRKSCRELLRILPVIRSGREPLPTPSQEEQEQYAKDKDWVPQLLAVEAQYAEGAGESAEDIQKYWKVRRLKQCRIAEYEKKYGVDSSLSVAVVA